MLVGPQHFRFAIGKSTTRDRQQDDFLEPLTFLRGINDSADISLRAFGHSTFCAMWEGPRAFYAVMNAHGQFHSAHGRFQNSNGLNGFSMAF